MFGHQRHPREVKAWRFVKLGIIGTVGIGLFFIASASKNSLSSLTAGKKQPAGTIEVKSPLLKEGHGSVGNYTFSGSGKAGSEVRLFGLKEIVTTKVDKAGHWTSDQKIGAAGKYEVTAKFFSGKEKLGESVPVSLEVLSKAPGKLAMGGQSLTKLASEIPEDVEAPVVYPDDDNSAPTKPKTGQESHPVASLEPDSEPPIKKAPDTKLPIKHGETKPKDAHHEAIPPKNAKPLPFVISSHTNQNIVPHGIIKLGGKGKVGDKVLVYVDNVLKMKSTIKPNGRWSAPVKINKPGKRKFKVAVVGKGIAKIIYLRIK